MRRARRDEVRPRDWSNAELRRVAGLYDGAVINVSGWRDDLEGEVPPNLAGRYQVAFNHTTLEYVYDIRRAVANICALSSDTGILATPFLQGVHFIEDSFGDYWRPAPMCLTRLLAEQAFTTAYQSCNDNPWYIVYVIIVATRDPDKYRGRLPEFAEPRAGARHFNLD